MSEIILDVTMEYSRCFAAEGLVEPSVSFVRRNDGVSRIRDRRVYKGIGETQWLQQRLSHRSVERLAGDAFNRIPENLEGQVRVDRGLERRGDRGEMLEVSEEIYGL